ncbi:HNH endonuclease [Aliarcobacter butzleri]
MFILDSFSLVNVKSNLEEFWKSINSRTNNSTNIDSFFEAPSSLMTLDDFIISRTPLTKKEIFNAKKIYFILLMNIGATSKFNKLLKKKILDKEYNYEKCKILIDNLLKRYDRHIQTGTGINTNYISLKADVERALNDFHSSERNERRLFLYFGFFQGKFEENEFNTFFALTHIGKKIVDSTFSQLLLIWEHQKIKMISQPPVNNFGQITKNASLNYNDFGINLNPYNKILEILNVQGSFSSNEYKFIISKIKDDFDYTIFSPTDKLQYIQRAKVSTYLRNQENSNYDFRKELKKYLLGVYNNAKDGTNNYLACISYRRKEYRVSDIAKLNFLNKNYKLLGDYLEKQYKRLYSNSEKIIKEKYLAKVNDVKFSNNKYDEVEYEWHKYIFNFDINLVLNLIYIHIAMKINRFDYKIPKTTIEKNLEEFKSFYQMTGIKNKKTITDKLKKIELFLSTARVNQFNFDKKTTDYKFRIINTLNLIELEKEMKKISKKQINFVNPDRKNELSTIIRNYYIGKFKDSITHLIKCDCCGVTTFFTETDDGKDKYAYLEFHHLIPLNENGAEGPDHYLNLFGVCPDCHRKFHKIVNSEKRKIYNKLSKNDNFKYGIVERIKRLKKENAIIPLHLEYLKKEFIISNQEYKLLNKKD